MDYKSKYFKYKNKYLKYKNKYLSLKNKLYGGTGNGIDIMISRQCKRLLENNRKSRYSDSFRIKLLNTGNNIVFTSFFRDILRQRKKNHVDNEDSYYENESSVESINYQINTIVDNKISFDNSISNTIIYEDVSEEYYDRFPSRREIGSIDYTFDLEKMNEVEDLVDVICEIFLLDIGDKLKKHFSTRLFMQNKKNIEESI